MRESARNDISRIRACAQMRAKYAGCSRENARCSEGGSGVLPRKFSKTCILQMVQSELFLDYIEICSIAYIVIKLA